MSSATQARTLYVAEPAETGISLTHDLVISKRSGETCLLSVTDHGPVFASTGESLDDYRKRRKEGRAWQAS